jgi:hypothetical protein
MNNKPLALTTTKLKRDALRAPSKARTRMGLWKKTFLATLAQTPSVTAACKVANVSRRTAYDHKELDPEFGAAWEDALNQSLDFLEHRLFVRGCKDDTRAAEIILKAYRPSLYSEKMRIEAAVVGGIILLPMKEAKAP